MKWLLLISSACSAATLNVPGDYATIQACANAAQPGDTCLVSAGTYNEYVTSVRSGSGEGARIVFSASGEVTMHGFNVSHQYITISGFIISEKAGVALLDVSADGSYCKILNNVIGPNVAGIGATIPALRIAAGASSANSCVVSGNTFKDLPYIHLSIYGNGHLFENNYFEGQLNDYVQVWGEGSTFRRNVFWRGKIDAANHPDFFQIFGDTRPGVVSTGHLFEENMIIDLTMSQFAQTNSGAPTSTPTPYPGYGNITFRRNIIANTHDNANVGLPGFTFENNTIFRVSYNGSGIALNTVITRGSVPNLTLKNNVLLALGNSASTNPGTSGFYSYVSAVTTEVVWSYITQHPSDLYTTVEQAIYYDLQAKGYTNGNGYPQAPAFTLEELTDGSTCDATALGQFVYGVPALGSLTGGSWTSATKTLVKAGAFVGYTVAANDAILITSSTPSVATGTYRIDSKTNNDTIVLGALIGGAGISTDRTDVTAFAADQTYKQRSCDAVVQTAAAENAVRSSFYADHNYVGGLPAAGYPPKRSSSCPVPSTSATLVTNNFCEPNGINGNDPMFQAGAALSSGVLALPNFTSSATWTAATNTLTKTGLFASYTPVAGDMLQLISNGVAQSGIYEVVSKTNSDTIVLGTIVDGSGISTDRTDVLINPISAETLITGPDGIPFTLDDGLKPSPGSPLCGAGLNGVDIGAYSCNPTQVFAGAATSYSHRSIGGTHAGGRQ